MFSLQRVLGPPQVAEEAGSCVLMLSWPLQVMESVVKNCGQTVHDEVANKQTMEELKEILKVNRFILLSFFFYGKAAAAGRNVCVLSCVLFG